MFQWFDRVKLVPWLWQQLYNLGARKIGVISIPPIGCCPSQRSLNDTGGCLEVLNESARAFYMATEAIMKDRKSVV